MFPIGSLLTLIGYSGLYIAGYRLMGDKRTVLGMLTGANGGALVRGSSGSNVLSTATSAIKSGAAGVDKALNSNPLTKQVGTPTVTKDKNGKITSIHLNGSN